MVVDINGKQIAVITALTIFATSALAAPDIGIGNLFDYLDANKSSMLKRVRNNGASTAFVRVSVSELQYDTKGKAVEKPTDIRSFSRTDGQGMVASPARMIVPAGGMQATRLLYRGPRDKERYYRVRFIPVLPEKQDQFAVSEDERKQYNEEMSAGVNLLTGYGAFVIVRPRQERYETRLSDGKGEYTVANLGNSTVVLDAFYNCSANDGQCTSPTVHHVLPGRTMKVKKEPGRSYRFDLIEGKQKHEVTF